MRIRVILPAIMLVSAIPAAASAYDAGQVANGNYIKWANNEYQFRVNVQSMVSNLTVSGIAPSTTDYTLWTTYAAGLWRNRTGADIDITYLGTTTLACAHVNDGTNVIGAQAGCKAAGCGTWAESASHWNSVTGALIDNDICLYGGSATWDLRTDLPSGNKDVVGVLVHEIGHTIGAGHTTGAVMQSDTHGLGNTLARFPYGDDIAFARAVYGVRTHQEYFKEYTASTQSWETTYVGDGVTNMAINGAIGTGSDGSWQVLRAKVNTTGDHVHFTRAAYPLTSSPSWSNRNSATSTFRSPSVAARGTSSPLWVAAWPLAETTVGCAGARFFASTNTFDSVTAVNVNDICTLHQIGLAYSPTADRFVMAYVAHFPDNTARESDTGRIFMRTSTNGWSWSSPAELDTGLYTGAGPSLACRADGACVLSYVDGDSIKQYDRQRAFTVSSAGVITLGASSGTNNWLADAPLMATSTTGSPDATILTLPWPSGSGNVAQGNYQLYAGQDDQFPVFVSSWVSGGETMVVRPGIASNPGRMRVYSFFAK